MVEDVARGSLMDARQRLHRAINNARAPHSPETQEITLILHDLAAEYAEDGWSLGYEIADDSPRFAPDGTEVDNPAIFAEEQRRHWGERLTRRSRDDDDAADDLARIPESGHYVLLHLVHEETGAEIVHWVERSALVTLVAGDDKGRAKRRNDIARAVGRGDRMPGHAAIKALIAPARGEAEARVTRKQERLKSGGMGRRER